MSTYMAKAGQVDRKWYIIDAAGKPLGRVAAQAAVLLRGKHKVDYTPHVDCGDHVIIINCAKAVLTGNKLEQKKWQRHTGWIEMCIRDSHRLLHKIIMERLFVGGDGFGILFGGHGSRLLSAQNSLNIQRVKHGIFFG